MPETITAFCPECQTRFALKPDMAGKKMRCANPDCREVFEVAPREEVAAAATPTERSVPASAPAPTFDWQSAPPPVQTEPSELPSLPSPVPAVETKLARSLFEAPKKRRSNHWVIFVLAFIVVGTIVTGGYVLVSKIGQAEERRAELAQKAYAEGRFSQAAEGFEALSKDFSGGARAPDYRFMAGLATIREISSRVPPEPSPAISSLNAFLDEQAKNPLLTAHKADIVALLQKNFADLASELNERLNVATPDVNTLGTTLERLRATLGLLEQHAATTETVLGPRAKVEELAARFSVVRAQGAGRSEALMRLTLPRPDVAGARQLMKQSNTTEDSAISAALKQAYATIGAGVKYTVDDRPPVPAPSPTKLTGILPEPKGPASNGPRVLLLAKGLLVGIEATSGRVAWADRVGIDATVAPVRIPADADEPPRWLTVSSDPPGLSCRADDGAIRWFQPLEALPVAPPVFVGQRAFLALGDPEGRVVAIDSRTGRRVGTFVCGEPLTGGLACRAGTSQLYAPAQAQYVFVLDGAPEEGEPRCLGLVLSEHTPGSICCAPTFAENGLVLCLTEGPTDSSINFFRLESNAPSALTAKLSVAGSQSWPPMVDGERLVAVTDLGAVGVFGLRQPGALDPPVFPLATRGAMSAVPQRSGVVYADESIVLVLAQGRLTPWRLGLDRQRGRVLAAAPPIADNLGSPVQPAIVLNDAILVVTVRAEPAGTLLTQIRRQNLEVTTWAVGMAIESPLFVAKDGVRAIDSQGGIVGLDAIAHEGAWQFGGRELARPIAGLADRPQLIGPWVVLPREKSVVLRPIAGGVDRAIELAAPLAGRPAHGDDWVFPLANGSLVRVAEGEARPHAGPTWRSPSAPTDARGHVIHWYDKTYLVTDGDRRLTRLRWAAEREFELASNTALERPRRIRGAPVVLTERRAAVADEGGQVTLLRGESLQVERAWKLGNDERRITDGPVLVGDHLAVILDGKELVWLNPNADKPAWTFGRSDAGLVGIPVLWMNKIAVADTLARVWLLDPATGKPVASDPTPLPAAIANTVVVSGDRLLVPLIDGTLVWLSQ